jgi:hypothetical protein
MVALRALAQDGPPIRRGPSQGHACADPPLLVQEANLEVFRPSSPAEVYSTDQPAFSPRSPEEENWIPIDVLLGRYEAGRRTIKIFYRNVWKYASSHLRCRPADLEYVVRVHEYCHALVHLGASWLEQAPLLEPPLGAVHTDWKSFLRARAKAFRSLPRDTHELLAQVLCWVAIGTLQPHAWANDLQEVFLALMSRQPPEYRLAPEILSKAPYADPTEMLSWVRETPRQLPPNVPSPNREVTEALLLATFRG